LAASSEYNPVLALLGKESRDNLLGKNGAVKQDMAMGRVMVGSAVGVYVGYLYANDNITGYGPTDPADRAKWLLTHNPYSVKFGGTWISFNRFGPLGTLLGLYSNVAEMTPYVEEGELAKAGGLLVHAGGRLLMDEAGMTGLDNIFQAIDDPDRKGGRYIANLAGSALPFSSLLRQTASAMDPEMRQTKTIIDGLMYNIPGLREQLQSRIDYAGRPIANAGYGFDLPIPGLSAVMQHREVSNDPVDLEMQRLDIKPAPPNNRVGGVQLPPELYNRYAIMAGTMAHTALNALVNEPGWFDQPVGAREHVFRQTIERAHKAAAEMMKAARPDIIETGMQNKERRIDGQKPVKLQMEQPSGITGAIKGGLSTLGGLTQHPPEIPETPTILGPRG
jgi:hypothetical protein